ncbi:MAG: S-layer homology domain-containing protein [Oscillospiraceae bacterium]|nr:S-layer homology domain-containing protein [Oscillospiraceae bacterium]
MKKRIFALLLAVLILGSALTPAVFADEGHVITFDPVETEGGSLNGATNWRRVPDGQPIGEMPVPTNSNPNMSFEGWFDDDHSEYTADTILTADVVVHAYWMEKQSAMPFTDIAGHWALEGIQFCYENGLMTGMTPTTFGPELTTTRGMVVTVLYRMENEPPVGGLINPFKDVEFPDWYGSAVVWAASEGIVNGVEKDVFDPNGNITREQLAAILYRYANYCKYSTDIKYVLNDFKDKDEVQEYAVEAMKWAYAAGLITGMQEGKDFYLKPGANATRAQIATILMRFMQSVVPHETKVGFCNLEMTLPASWYNEYTYEAALNEDGSSYCTFRCRREQEAGMGGMLFSIELRKPPVPDYPTAYEVVGTLSKDGEYYNIIIVYGGGVECDQYKDLYFAMKAEKDNIVKSFVGYNGWKVAFG